MRFSPPAKNAGSARDKLIPPAKTGNRARGKIQILAEKDANNLPAKGREGMYSHDVAFPGFAFESWPR